MLGTRPVLDPRGLGRAQEKREPSANLGAWMSPAYRGMRSTSELPPATTDRFGGSTGTGLTYALSASHSLSFDQRLSFCVPLTAIASAFRCPTSTTRRFPRVTPV
jgi:hypothetical protein